MRAHALTRRQLLAHLASGAALTLAAHLTACGAATPVPSATSVLEGEGCWSAGMAPRSPQPGDPYRGGAIGEGIAFSFAQGVRDLSNLVVLGTVRERLAARWTTPDGHRPANPHTSKFIIITPVRVAVERVAKGGYALPDIYLAAWGGAIGQDCAYYTGSGPRASYPVGRRVLYLLTAERELAALSAQPGDDRYRYFYARQSYIVADDDTITIGPASDIMGNRYDNPPRTLPVTDALREIATLLATPAATPVR